MADIFISYASEDRDRVIPIVKALEEEGWSTFWDWKSIPVGKTWREFIDEELEAARCILVLWSNSSATTRKRWVLEEADFGLEREILIPALIDDVRPPRGFGQIQAARLTGWKGELSHDGFKQLKKALTDLLGSAKIRLIVHEHLNAVPSQQKIINSIGMEFVLIPTGSFRSFTMGSSTGDKDEKPPHNVKISQPFCLQATEVTQRQWKKVMGDNPSEFKDCGDDCPVEQISWEEAKQFIEKLNQLEQTKGYRLPSEAEWEYACRAGMITEYSFGDDANKLDEYAWYGDNSSETTQRVAGKKPNSWGLYDMHGNVWEWVEDDYHNSYDQAPADGSAWVDNPRGSGRVIRGGSWFSVAQYCRSASRGSCRPDYRSDFLGFRLSRSVAFGD